MSGKRDYCNGNSTDGLCGITSCAIIRNGNCGPSVSGNPKKYGPPDNWERMKQDLFRRK